MKTNILPAIKLTLVCLLFCCGLYSIILLGIAQIAPNHGKGEIISANNKTYYSNIAQNFSDHRYFHTRPSSVAYNAAGSGGSNKATTNPEYLTEVQARIDTFLVHNPEVRREEIPSDLVTASGSGLDPDISPEAAKVQMKRIAAARNMDEQTLLLLIEQIEEKPLLGLFGPAKLNVLKLNLALDQIKTN